MIWDRTRLTDGNDLVSGEIWTFAQYEVTATLAALDEIEGYHGEEDDEYKRVMVEYVAGTRKAAAWTYLYARVYQLMPQRRIKPGTSGLCRWPADG